MTSHGTLTTVHGEIPFPAFLPDATLGVVRSLDASDLETVGIQALVMNAYHLMQKPGTSTVHALGGIHRMAGWTRPILTDSGGFQAYSLIRQNPKWGKITDQGIRFRPEGSERELNLTPEKCVQVQLAYGADIVVCLDECTHADDPPDIQERSVARTIAWAKRCKTEFVRILGQRKIRLEDSPRPLLFGVVQGGGDADLRRRCADALLEIGFDGYGYGGWPLDKENNLLVEMLYATRQAIPLEFPLHALGVGHPASIARCAAMGYSTFDSALPTRDARSGRLYVWQSDPQNTDFSDTAVWLKSLYIDDEKHIKSNIPISPFCDCLTCSRYSVGYLRHLHKSGETLYFRLATLHNLRFMTQLMEALQTGMRETDEG
jgi:queuine tRNA-ribosyltransferase